jgi:hypothetical protein
VEYVGRDDAGLLRRYRTRPGFVDALDRGRYDYLVIGRGQTPPARKPPREEAWARSAGYSLVAQSPTLLLYRRG